MKKLVWKLCFFGIFVTSFAWAGPREEIEIILDNLPNNWPEAGLNSWINDGKRRNFIIDDEVVFHFRSQRDCYIHLVFLDNQGVLTTVTPDFGKGDNFLESGIKVVYPPETANVKLTIGPPLGKENVYVIATNRSKPLPRDGTFAGTKIAKKINSILEDGYISTKVALIKSQHWIKKRPKGPEYRKRDIIAHYRKYRTIYRPKENEEFEIQLAAHFELDKHTLTPQAKTDLNEWGKAMLDPELKGKSWILKGHTCDLGPEDYNFDLSRRRALSAKNYLIINFDIEPNNLSIKPYGETQPANPHRTKEARADNRRVEFVLQP